VFLPRLRSRKISPTLTVLVLASPHGTTVWPPMLGLLACSRPQFARQWTARADVFRRDLRCAILSAIRTGLGLAASSIDEVGAARPPSRSSGWLSFEPSRYRCVRLEHHAAMTQLVGISLTSLRSASNAAS
jgi:hypothetical protein